LMVASPRSCKKNIAFGRNVHKLMQSKDLRQLRPCLERNAGPSDLTQVTLLREKIQGFRRVR